MDGVIKTIGTNIKSDFDKSIVEYQNEINQLKSNAENNSGNITDDFIQRIRNRTKRLHKEIDNVEESVLEQVKVLPSVQQKELVSFWENISDFFRDVIIWLWKKLEYLFIKIWAGVKALAQSIKNVVDNAKEWFTSIF